MLPESARRFWDRGMHEQKRRTMTERSQIATSFLPLPGSAPVEWRIEPGLTAYPEALAFMEARAEAISARPAAECQLLK